MPTHFNANHILFALMVSKKEKIVILNNWIEIRVSLLRIMHMWEQYQTRWLPIQQLTYFRRLACARQKMRQVKKNENEKENNISFPFRIHYFVPNLLRRISCGQLGVTLWVRQQRMAIAKIIRHKLDGLAWSGGRSPFGGDGQNIEEQVAKKSDDNEHTRSLTAHTTQLTEDWHCIEMPVVCALARVRLIISIWCEWHEPKNNGSLIHSRLTV